MYSGHFVVCSVRSAVCSRYFAVGSLQCAVCKRGAAGTLQTASAELRHRQTGNSMYCVCAVSSVLWEVFSVHFSMCVVCSVQCSLCSGYSAVCSVQCAVCSVQCAGFTV